MIDLMWPGCSPRFIKALCKLMIKGQSMQYYGAAAKKGADAEGRWLQAKRAAVASSQEVLKKSGAGGGAGTSVGAEAWHMYVDTKSPEFRGLMTALVSLGLEFQIKCARSRWPALLQVDKARAVRPARSARGRGTALFEHVFRSRGGHRADAGLESSSKDCNACAL
jgi:hypothetical protein